MIACVAAIAICYLVVCYVLSRAYLQPTRRVPELPKGLFEVGVPRPGHPSDPAWCTPGLAGGNCSSTVFVLAHGYGGTRDAWSELMLMLSERGIDAVAPALPGQDASPQPEVGFGIKEAETLNRAAQWVRQKAPYAEVVYMGISMGGAAAWLASERDPAAAGVVSEGAYAVFEEAMGSWFERKAPGSRYYLRPVVWIASATSGLRPDEVLPLRAAEAWRGRPALVIQAADDVLIEESHAARLASASGAELWRVSGASHAGCFEANPEAYVEMLIRFAQAQPAEAEQQRPPEPEVEASEPQIERNLTTRL